MSHHALQRLVVRLLYDPELVERVYADPEPALADLDLTRAERQWVVAPDRRAYLTDPHRRSRSLTELLREFPAAASLVAQEAGGLALLDRFFSSPIFHAVIEHRGSLARAFGDYLLALAAAPGRDTRLAPFARLEQAIAGVRRAPAATTDAATTDANTTEAAATGATATDPAAPEIDRWLVATPRSALVRLPAGTIEEHAAVLAALTRDGRDPVAAIAGDRLELPAARSAISAPDEPVLIESAARMPGEEPEIRLSPVTAELAELLLAAAPPGAPTSTLHTLARRLGAEPGEEVELIADLVREDLLIAIATPARHASC